MLLWFIGPAIAIVWVVFRSPMADHRMVAVGAVLPLLEAATGGPPCSTPSSAPSSRWAW